VKSPAVVWNLTFVSDLDILISFEKERVVKKESIKKRIKERILPTIIETYLPLDFRSKFFFFSA
jgi:hypothetical protein